MSNLEVNLEKEALLLKGVLGFVRTKQPSLFKANKTYEEITNIFKAIFPEVVTGFSEQNVCLFVLNTNLKEPEIDTILDECKSKVTFRHFAFLYCYFYPTRYSTTFTHSFLIIFMQFAVFLSFDKCRTVSQETGTNSHHLLTALNQAKIFSGW